MVPVKKNPIVKKNKHYARVSLIFAMLLVLSMSALVVSLVVSQGSTERPPGMLWPRNTPDRDLDTLRVLSLLASVASIIGFFSTTCPDDYRGSQVLVLFITFSSNSGYFFRFLMYLLLFIAFIYRSILTA